METSHNESAANAGQSAAALGMQPLSSSSVSTLQPGESSTQAQMISTRHDISKKPRTESVGLRYRDPQTGDMVHRSLKKKDWETYKDIIINEYIVRNQTLNTVIQTLKTKHGFSATPKMYKTRLSQWGMHKNTSKKPRPLDERKGPIKPLDLSLLEESQPKSSPQSASKPAYGPIVPYFLETMRSGDLEPLTTQPKVASPPKQTNPFRPGNPSSSNVAAGKKGPVLKGTPQATPSSVSPLPITACSNSDTGLEIYSPATEHQHWPSRTHSETITSPAEHHHIWSQSTEGIVSNNTHYPATQFYHDNAPFNVENAQPAMKHYLTSQVMPYDRYAHAYSPSPTTLHVSRQGHQLTRDIIYDCVEGTCGSQSRITILGDGWDNLNTFLTSARKIPHLMNAGELEMAGEIMRQTSAQIEPLMRGKYDGGGQWGPGPGPVAMTGMLRIFRLFHKDLPDFFKVVMEQAYRLAVVWVPSEHHPTRRILAHMIEISGKPEADRLAIAEIVSESYSWLTTKMLELAPSREVSYLTWLLLLMYPEGSDDFMAYQHGQGLQKMVSIWSHRFGDGHIRTRDAISVYEIYLFRECKVMNLKCVSPEQLAGNMVKLLGFHLPGPEGGGCDQRVTEVSGSRLAYDGPDDADEEMHRASSVAEQTILDAVYECIKLKDFRSALGYCELLEQWHAFRRDAVREAQIIAWRRQLEMGCGWSPGSCDHVPLSLDAGS
ncbi:hypothetical protein PspLS_09537 [Pyricularia sp. CBS 133598]|nr:hypothetical protein PspLS_09537 [Pyricularia sp. CBS 133598]